LGEADFFGDLDSLSGAMVTRLAMGLFYRLSILP
jgi:hypothetical protein